MTKRLFAFLEVIGGRVVKTLLGEDALDTVKKIVFLGPREYLSALRRTRQELSKTACFHTHLAICTIAKDEGPYFDEWLRFHIAVGVDKFYVYDNGSSDNTRTILQPFIAAGYVEYISFPGEKMQLPAYQHCVRHHAHDTEWIAFIDLDEFIVPTREASIKEFLANVPPDYNQISLRWLLFGSNGHIKRPSGLVIENYTRCGGTSTLTKPIVNPRAIFRIGVHEHLVSGKTLRVPLTNARIHHYHCKSKEEYGLKALKGDVAYGQLAGQLKYHDRCFMEHDCNEREDYSALRFLSQLRSVTIQLHTTHQ